MIIAGVVLSVMIVPSAAFVFLAWLDHRVPSPRACMCRLRSYVDPSWRGMRR